MRGRNMRRMHGSAAKESAVASGEPEAWTYAGSYERNLLAAAAKLDALLENLKAKGASSIEGMEQDVVRRINLARRDVAFSKGVRTWIVFGTVLTGFTVGSTWVLPLRKE